MKNLMLRVALLLYNVVDYVLDNIIECIGLPPAEFGPVGVEGSAPWAFAGPYKPCLQQLRPLWWRP